MQRLSRIHAIKDRTRALRLSIKDICAAAEPRVPDSTVSRWLNNLGSPRLDTYEDFCARLEAVLAGLEQAELGRLSKLAPAPAPAAAAGQAAEPVS